MDKSRLSEILQAVADGTMLPLDAIEHLAAEKPAGYVDLGHTRLDTDRRRRRGISEAVFCEGKTPGQITEIARKLDSVGQNVICTRVTGEVASEIIGELPGFSYDPVARLLYKINE